MAFTLTVLAGCAAPPSVNSVSLPAIAPRTGRIWFYRAYEPYAGKGLPAVWANGAYVGSAELGGAFYRDLPPGHYTVTVETVGRDVNQTAQIDLASGQEAYVKIVSLPEWVSGGDITQYERPTFYAWAIPSGAAQREIANLAYYGGR